MIDTILNLLRSDGYVTTHRTLMKNIGLSPAVVFSELCSRYKYFLDRNELKDGYFYCTIPTLESDLGLSRKEQDSIFNKLIALGLIEKKVTKLKGDEAPKRYIKITSDITVVAKYIQDRKNPLSEGQPPSPPKNDAKPIENTGFVQKGQIDLTKRDKSNSDFGTPIRIRQENNIKRISQSVSQSDLEDSKEQTEQTDGQTDELNLIYQKAQIDKFHDESLQQTFKDVIKELYLKHPSKIAKLKLEHIDEAWARFRRESESKPITNKIGYFKQCLLSTIQEVALTYAGYTEQTEEQSGTGKEEVKMPTPEEWQEYKAKIHAWSQATKRVLTGTAGAGSDL